MSPRLKITVSLEPDEHAFVVEAATKLGFTPPTLVKEAALSSLRWPAETAWRQELSRSRPNVRGILLDHICKDCGGRIMQVVGHGPTPGGNPVYLCTLCGRSKITGFGDLCWCDFSHRSGHWASAYMCLPFSILETKPWLREAFTRAGSMPESGRSVIGVMLVADYRRLVDAPPQTP
jgi:hypothetical protein